MTYAEAVHYAADRVLASPGLSYQSRAQRLTELLHSLAQSIPESWATTSRTLLTRPDSTLDQILTSLSRDILRDPDSRHYLVLSSVYQLALVIKQYRENS